MVPTKKRVLALLCLLAATLTLLLPWALAAPAYEEVYLVGVNDSVMLSLINDDLMPVRRSGAIYVPYTVLDNKDLGLSYALNRNGGTFTVFDRKQSLIFYLDGSGSVDREGNSQTGRIITRNGVVFFPLRFVSTYFGLTYSFYNLVLPEGTVPIARVCTSSATLTDQQFGASVPQLVAGPLSQYAATLATPTPTATEPPSPSPSALPEAVDVCFAIACTDGSGFQRILDAFASARLSALFLFSPDDLLSRDADVRAAAAAGHQIGLLLPSQDSQAAFDLGNQRLRHILRTEATQVAFLEGTAAEGNWWTWSGNVFPRGGGANAQAANLAQDVNQRTVARVTLYDSRSNAQALQRNMPTWRQRPYTLFTPTETS